MARTILGMLLSLLASSSTWASVNIQNFSHTNSFGFESLDSLLIDDSDVAVIKSYILTAAFSYNSKPLDMKNLNNNITVGTVIDDFQIFHLGAGYRFKDNLSIGFMTALVGLRPSGQSRSWKLQDSQVELNYTFLKRSSWALGLLPFITLPTGDQNSYLSDESTGYGAKIQSQFNLSSWNFVAGLGYRIADRAVDAVDPFLNLRERMILELGLLKPLFDKWNLLVEFKREYTLPIKNDLNPNELFVGTRYSWNPDLGIFAGLGSGDLSSTASGDIRAHLGLKFAPQAPPPVCRMVPQNREAFKIVLGFQNNKDQSDTADLVSRLLTFVEKNRDLMEKVRVVGHTSSVGDANYNEKLSVRRAKAVASMLTKAGAPKDLLASEGRGERELLSSENSDNAHNLNRRVEVTAELKPKMIEVCE